MLMFEDETLDVKEFNKPIETKTYQKGGFNKFATKKKDPTDNPYRPVLFYINNDIYHEYKDSILSLVDKMIKEGFVIRITDDPIDMYKDITAKHSGDKVEVYIPWKNFSEIDSKYYFNDDTSKLIAEKYVPGYAKVPDAVKAFMARNVRAVFGDKNSSPVVFIVVGSKDSAMYRRDVKQETGRAGAFIHLGSTSKVNIFNVTNKKSMDVLTNLYFPGE